MLLLELNESNKSLATIAEIKDYWKKINCPTDWVIIGGGVALDCVSFAASLCRASYTSYPTTLLSMVDAATGGKTGVNCFPYGKNLIGSFHPPQQIIICSKWLSTLPLREWISGSSECIKHGLLLGDKKFINKLIAVLKDRNYQELNNLLPQLIKVKQTVVRRDPYETKEIRQILNYGHTLAHALEAVSQQEKKREHAFEK